jgi:YesN/AraC family two-component response regulator
MFQANIDEQKTKIQTKPATRKDEIFHMFIREVEKNYKMERNVTFYADKLCISPKYLSSVIHDVSGRYATEWIDGFVILESKAMLKSNGNTIKEICNKLNFANQSFFAKYFKQHTGLTPKEYRNKE